MFSALVGVDTNEQTSGGRGSVVFSVTVAGQAVFQSARLKEGMAAVPVRAELNGAREFTLEVGDGGDGISCDQADWANAQVTLEDGSSLWVGDLPVHSGQREAYGTEPFFSFKYDGQASSGFLPAWKLERATRDLDQNRVEHTLTYTHPGTGLVLRCVAVEYRDFPTVEWTLYFRNTGKQDSPILSDIQAIDTRWDREDGPNAGSTEFGLHHHVGSPCRADDFRPLETILGPGAEKRIGAAGGRPSNSDWPYFNVQQSPAEGAIVVVGWPGQWTARFLRDQGNHLHVQAGQERTHFKLLPGEEVRSPLIVLQFWKGNRVHSQNVWRSWMLKHNLPRPGGKLPPVQLAACSSHQFNEMCNASTESQKFFVDRYLEEGLQLDYWWMDAGWYPCDGVGWPKTGTWEVDTRRFPKGLREISDHARAKNVKTIVWFEPERVHADTWLTQNHPEWILGGQQGGLLNLGNPDAWNWLVEHIDGLIVGQGIDLYRQDFNMDPLDYWRRNDAEDRQGITEIKHVAGYLAYWDELRRRHPNLLIDSCASGGRRNDLETLRRAVPLLRSDYLMEPVGNQGHTYGLSSWLPYYGTGSSVIDAYQTRSVLCPHFTACFDMRKKDLNYAEAWRLFSQWRQFAPCMLEGDFYPLTPYSLDKAAWIGWQFDCPERGEGVIQVFRRDESPYESLRVRLGGLDPAAAYTLTNLDLPGAREIRGHELLEKGLSVAIADQPGSVVIIYKKRTSSSTLHAP
jgi:alpha-galactosidase